MHAITVLSIIRLIFEIVHPEVNTDIRVLKSKLDSASIIASKGGVTSVLRFIATKCKEIII